MITRTRGAATIVFSLSSGLGCGLFIMLAAFAESNIYIIPPAWIRLLTMAGLVCLGLSLIPALMQRASLIRPLLGILISLPIVIYWAWIRYENGFPTQLSNGLGALVTIAAITVILLTAKASMIAASTPAKPSHLTYIFYSVYALISGSALINAGFMIAGIDPAALPRYIAASLLAMMALKGFVWMKAVKAGEILPGDPVIRRHRIIFNGCLLIAAGLQLTGSPWGSLIFMLAGIGLHRKHDIFGNSA